RDDAQAVARCPLPRQRWIRGDCRVPKTGGDASESAGLVDARDGLHQRLVRRVRRRDQSIEVAISIEAPPLFGQRVLVAARPAFARWISSTLRGGRRRRFEAGGLLDRRTNIVRT